MNKKERDEILTILEPFAEQAKFADSEGPGYLMKEDWKKLRKLYWELKEKENELANMASNI